MRRTLPAAVGLLVGVAYSPVIAQDARPALPKQVILDKGFTTSSPGLECRQFRGLIYAFDAPPPRGVRVGTISDYDAIVGPPVNDYEPTIVRRGGAVYWVNRYDIPPNNWRSKSCWVRYRPDGGLVYSVRNTIE